MYQIDLYGKARWVCAVCLDPIELRDAPYWNKRGRFRHYCSNACRQKAYRKRYKKTCAHNSASRPQGRSF